MVVAGLVHTASHQGALGAQHIPAGQVKVGIVGKGGPGDLGGRRSLEGSLLAQVVSGAFLGCGLESQQCLECPAMHYTVTGVTLRLETEGVEI